MSESPSKGCQNRSACSRALAALLFQQRAAHKGSRSNLWGRPRCGRNSDCNRYDEHNSKCLPTSSKAAPRWHVAVRLRQCGRMIRMRSSYLCVVCDRFDLLREASIKSHVHACGPFSSSGDWSGCRSALETHLTAKLCPLVRPDFPAALSCFSPISGTTKLAVPTAFVADAAALSLQHHGPIAWGSYDYADRRGLSRVQCV